MEKSPITITEVQEIKKLAKDANQRDEFAREKHGVRSYRELLVMLRNALDSKCTPIGNWCIECKDCGYAFSPKVKGERDAHQTVHYAYEKQQMLAEGERSPLIGFEIEKSNAMKALQKPEALEKQYENLLTILHTWYRRSRARADSGGYTKIHPNYFLYAAMVARQVMRLSPACRKPYLEEFGFYDQDGQNNFPSVPPNSVFWLPPDGYVDEDVAKAEKELYERILRNIQQENIKPAQPISEKWSWHEQG
ncbi:hypothetical protein [Pseudomonas sp. 2FE]|uniref:hypothetical protein n=1 Tax=Pseudomonas sp. 2FE TaxID=2502190 RepID=UPI0010F8B837|nr:hypothetical protein [Pseudomonas sp. 2FE]